MTTAAVAGMQMQTVATGGPAVALGMSAHSFHASSVRSRLLEVNTRPIHGLPMLELSTCPIQPHPLGILAVLLYRSADAA